MFNRFCIVAPHGGGGGLRRERVREDKKCVSVPHFLSSLLVSKDECFSQQ
jgi:hypothetical protein